jgi:fermentation-respiration switch protein FrsA (DUF1100 family)
MASGRGLVKWAALAGLVCAPSGLAAQAFPRDPATVTFSSSVDGSEQPYALYVPRSFRPDGRYPLVISLHGEDVPAQTNLFQLFGLRPPSFLPDFGVSRGTPLPDVGFIVACPLARGAMGFQGIAEQDVYDVLADVERRYPVDEDRVYLTGISMGGGGALWLALTRPDVWAAVAPLCAATVPGSEELAPNALNLPIRLFHGEADIVVPAQSSRAWQKRLLDAGAPAEYLEYAGARHNAWDFAYRNNGVFDWFASQRRPKSPERVRFVTRSYRYSSAYWVRIDGLTPGELSSIDARRLGKSEARVETRGLDGFSFAGPVLALPAVVTIDGEPLRVKAGSPLSFERAAGHWRQGAFQPAGKRPGAEGPMLAALSARHIYVYGTADDPGPQELDARRRAAQRAATWSAPAARVIFSPPVKADSAVSAADIAESNLVLFGTRYSNSLIARFAADLPMELQSGAADYGLAFIVPLGKRYVLVTSGLSLWSGAPRDRGGYQFAPWPYRLLSTFGDFVLFKGSLDDVVSEGRFDRNWKLPPDASARMLATGTVTIRK